MRAAPAVMRNFEFDESVGCANLDLLTARTFRGVVQDCWLELADPESNGVMRGRWCAAACGEGFNIG